MRIAIVGTGISGMVAAYLLNRENDITVFEKNDYVGGHTRTVEVNYDGVSIPVDTGFIVFNHKNYPNLTTLFSHLGVATQKSNMSFAVSINNGWLEYGTQRLTDMFGQKLNLFRPKFYGLILDILKFNKEALKLLENKMDITLGEFINKLGMSEWFKDYYLLPMGGAIWSTSVEKMLDFPAITFIQFFHNHGLLTVNDQPQWHTVTGGSREYVTKLTETFKDKIKTNTEVVEIIRQNGRVRITDNKGNTEKFDQVIIAAHGDQALNMLKDAHDYEKEVLGHVHYQDNTAYLHKDESFMPKNKSCWSSWVYLSEEEKNDKSISLTYWMNLLQRIDNKYPLFVTLNPTRKPDPDKIFDINKFEHPIYDKAMVKAQKLLPGIQGRKNTWFCGSYHGYCFHEDGATSGIKVAEKLGAKVNWR